MGNDETIWQKLNSSQEKVWTCMIIEESETGRTLPRFMSSV